MAFISKEHLSEIVPLVGLLFIFAIIFLIWRHVPEDQLRGFINSAGILAPLVWMGISLVTYIVAPLSGTPMLLIGFYAFGRFVILYTILVGLVGAAINFMIARHLGRKVVTRLLGTGPLKKIDHITKNYGMESLFFMRVFLSSFHDALSYAAGLTAISFPRYMIATALAFIPSGIIWYLVSLSSEDPIVFTGISVGVSFVLSAIFFAGSWIHRKYYSK